MPLKNGEMTLGELKRLVKKYDELMSLKTTGMNREKLLEEIDLAGYDVNHKKMKLELKLKQKVKKMPKTVKMPPKPVPKSDADKKKAKDKKRESVIQYIIKNKDVLDDERVKSL
jgi:hypothetical protein